MHTIDRQWDKLPDKTDQHYYSDETKHEGKPTEAT